MAVENAIVNSTTDVSGNSYTTAVSNDTLTNNDFLTLMLEEMKQQDPTKPMDSNALLDSQLQMSQIQTNADMANAMEELTASYQASNISTAAGLIGIVVETGELGEDGIVKSYKVETAESIDGSMYLNTRQMIGLTDNLAMVEGESTTAIEYDSEGYLYEEGTRLDIRVQLGNDGRFAFNDDTTIKLLDADGELVTDTSTIEKYKHNGTSIEYSPDVIAIPLSGISKIR
jgi:flagellar basal-body rod modification protein FlgD